MSLAGLGDESQEVRKLLEFSKDAVTSSRDASVDPLSLCVLSAPKGQGSLLPSNRRRTDKQQRFVSVDAVFTDFYIYCDNLLFHICFFPSGLQVKASPPGGSGFHQLRGQIRPHVRSLQNNQAVTQSQNQ